MCLFLFPGALQKLGMLFLETEYSQREIPCEKQGEQKESRAGESCPRNGKSRIDKARERGRENVK
jgi:hypothetical protein